MEDSKAGNPSAITILLVEDDHDTASVVVRMLEKNGFDCVHSSSGEDALSELKKKLPSLVLLDLMLPGMKGFEVCRRMKDSKQTAGIPIIIVSSDDAEEQIVEGLNLGADDYVTKPYSPAILIARINMVLRRSQQQVSTERILQFEGLRLDNDQFIATADDVLLDLSVSEFKILAALMRVKGKVLTRQQIISTVHGKDYPVTGRSVDVQIVSLRKKLGRYADFIETTRGVGYRFTG